MRNFLLSVVIFLLVQTVHSKVLIFTYCYSNPEFVEMQCRSFNALIADEFEFIVFSDAPTEEVHNSIVATCQANGVKCIRIPQHIHQPPLYLPLNMPEIYTDPIRPSNVRHVHAVQYSLDHYGFNHDDIVVLIDNDMFFVRPIKIADFMKNCDIATFMKGSSNDKGQHMHYCCPALTFLNMKTLPEKETLNFNCGWVNGCSADSGGFTYYYLIKHPELRIKIINQRYSGHLFCSDRFVPNSDHLARITPLQKKINSWRELGFNEKEVKFLSKNPDTIEFYMCESNCWLLHYRGGTNYEKLSPIYHQKKKILINEYLRDVFA